MRRPEQKRQRPTLPRTQLQPARRRQVQSAAIRDGRGDRRASKRHINRPGPRCQIRGIDEDRAFQNRGRQSNRIRPAPSPDPDDRPGVGDARVRDRLPGQMAHHAQGWYPVSRGRLIRVAKPLVEDAPRDPIRGQHLIHQSPPRGLPGHLTPRGAGFLDGLGELLDGGGTDHESLLLERFLLGYQVVRYLSRFISGRKRRSKPGSSPAKTQAAPDANQRKAPPAGFEPATNGLEIRCSVQLSYGGSWRSLRRQEQQLRIWRATHPIFPGVGLAK